MFTYRNDLNVAMVNTHFKCMYTGCAENVCKQKCIDIKKAVES